MSLSYLDIIIAIPFIWFGFKGFRNGAVMEAVKMIALFGGLWIAIHCSHRLESLWHLEGPYRYICYFVLCFLAVVITVFLSGYLLTTLIKTIQLNWLNRLLGVIFAFLKTLIVLGVIIHGVNLIDPHQKILPKEDRDASLLFKPTQSCSEFLLPILKEQIQTLRQSK